jgi:hypothetical protein
MNKPIETLFKAAGCLESQNTLFEVCDRFTHQSSMFSEHLTNHLSQNVTLRRIPLLDP